MHTPPKVPPRFVPTLTEVVPESDETPVELAFLPQPSKSAALEHGASRPEALPVAPQQPMRQDMEEYMVHRVMQRVDVALDQRLREAIATVVQEQTRSVLPRLREEIESVVRHAVYEAVADELASGGQGHRS